MVEDCVRVAEVEKLLKLAVQEGETETEGVESVIVSEVDIETDGEPLEVADTDSETLFDRVAVDVID